MPRAKDKFKDLEKLSFEEALSRLESIVEAMEDGKAPLESMISSFEEGGALAEICQRKLDGLQRKIEILVKDSPQGGKWRDFDGSEALPDEEPPDQAPPPKASQDRNDDLLF